MPLYYRHAAGDTMGEDDTELEDKLQALQQQTLAMHTNWQQEQAAAHACKPSCCALHALLKYLRAVRHKIVLDGILEVCQAYSYRRFYYLTLRLAMTVRRCMKSNTQYDMYFVYRKSATCAKHPTF